MTIPYNSKTPDDDFGLLQSDLKFSATLAVTTDTPFTVPGNASRYKAVFKASGTGTVFVAVNETAEVPVGAAFASTTSEIVPKCREVRSGDVVHFMSDTAGMQVSVALYGVIATA